MSLCVYFVSLFAAVHPLHVTNTNLRVYFVNLRVTVRFLRITNASLHVMNIRLRVRQHKTMRNPL